MQPFQIIVSLFESADPMRIKASLSREEKFIVTIANKKKQIIFLWVGMV